MNTLETITPLLDRLFEEDERSSAALEPALSGISSEERSRLMRSKANYRELYRRLAGFALPVSRETGRLLYLLARAQGARTIVEFGTSFGISTLHLAAALKDNGGGRLITSEFEPLKVVRARANLESGGLLDLVEIREGDALLTLGADLPETIDLVLLDGAKALYLEILDLLERRLRKGSLVVADDALQSPEYLERVRSAASGYLSLPLLDDVELSLRLA